MRVYIGYDEREDKAFQVAKYSLLRQNSMSDYVKLQLPRLQTAGLYTRPTKLIGGQLYDLISDAPMSTLFAISRFLTPLLNHEGWALFVDSDVVFLRDPVEMLEEIEYGKAVYVVKHAHAPTKDRKMDGVLQTTYPRKNWSSVMLFDCEHPANRRLNLPTVNHLPGRDLHAFCWLDDSEIGELSPAWNWLVNEQPRPSDLGIAHFTLGGPWFDNWSPAPNDEIWKEVWDEYRRNF